MKILTQAQAVDIFIYKALAQQKPKDAKKKRSFQNTALCSQLSKLYRVNVKTIRDIWNRRNWKLATSHLWPLIDGNNHHVLLSADEESSIPTDSSPVDSNFLESTSQEDPFHNDWPHWERSCRIEDVTIV
jgi:hypothetical protein